MGTVAWAIGPTARRTGRIVARRGRFRSIGRDDCSRQGQVSDLVTSEEEQPPVVGLPPSSRSAAHFGVIVFLASDVMLFAPFFAAYFLLRADNQPWPPEGVEL